MADFDAARTFIQREGRVLEQRLAATIFDGADAQGVVDAVAAYRNPDGGFGHGLEPDKRVPHSQPLDVERAFDALADAGRFDEALVRPALDYLAGVGPGVPCVLPNIKGWPLAAHWEEGALEDPSLNPTGGILEHLYRHDVDHPWREQATEFCWAELEQGLPREAHTLREALAFLAAQPDRDRAEKLTADAPAAISGAEWMRLDPADPNYGLTPLDFVPEPDAPLAGLFPDDQVQAFLDLLDTTQEDDGGWAIRWEPPGVVATYEWRAIVTLRAIRTLRAYGRA